MRLLIVDDEVRLAETIAGGLRAEGYAVDLAHDGRAGLDLAADNRYELIILDVMLPGLNGLQVCQRLRTRGDTTPVLMLTAKDGEYDEAEGLDTGADDYLTKPFSFLVLQSRIRALLRRRSTGLVPEVWRFGDLTIDPLARTCSRGDRQIRVTSKEFAVLEYLAMRGGQVVSKTELLENIWDFAYDGGVNIVEVNISNLRRKIDNPFGRNAIVTARGAGYRMAVDGG